MEQKYFPKFNISEGGNPYHGVNVILTQYHLICNTYLSIGIYYTIIIPVLVLNSLINFIYHVIGLVPSYHPIYYSATKFKYYPTLRKHNDSVIMYIIKICTDEEEYESVKKIY